MDLPASKTVAPVEEAEPPRSPAVPAAGAALWRPGDDGSPEVAVVHRPHYDDWSLPKGKVDPGELPAHTAVREIREETGFSCVLSRFLTEVHYPVPAASGGTAQKRVTYFAAKATGGAFAANEEVDVLRWVSPARAREILSYGQDVAVLDAFESVPTDARTVLLVRHAHAGSRAKFDGDDTLRPLSETGQKQSAALHRLLPLFGPARVHSAPRTRCEQTVSPIAEDLGGEIQREPLLSEEGFREQPAAAVRRLLRLADEPGATLVCSQGGAIPELLSRLAQASGYPLSEVPSAKGSVWTLTFQPRSDTHDGSDSLRLVGADYLPDARA